MITELFLAKATGPLWQRFARLMIHKWVNHFGGMACSGYNRNSRGARAKARQGKREKKRKTRPLRLLYEGDQDPLYVQRGPARDVRLC